METFKIGDFTRLKSGGPRMTVVTEPWTCSGPINHRQHGVTATGTITMITCQWFDGNNGLHAGDFLPETLVADSYSSRREENE